jgi:UDP-N-acetyl-D-mannosaminuronate dehydrogenase
MVRKLTEMGAEVKVHDPYVEHWWEFEAQDTFCLSGCCSRTQAEAFVPSSDHKLLRVAATTG